MKLLLLNTPDQESFIPNFQRLPSLFGHKVQQTTAQQVNTATVHAACKKLGVEGVIISQSSFLNAALKDTPDFIPPDGRSAITLDDYAGSMLKLRGEIPMVVINPLERLLTVPYEKFVLDRYLSKLTKPEKWYKETPFKWQMVEEHDVVRILQRLESARLIGIDIETPGDELRSMSCVSYTCFFPDTHTTESYCIGFDQLWQWQAIRQFNLTQPPKVFQNGLYDNSYFMRWNVPVHNWLHDSFHLFHSWLSELPKRLDFVASFALRNIRFWKNDGKHGFESLCRYCCLDSWATVNSYLSLLSECPEWALDNYRIEFPLVFPAITAGLEGVKIDEERFKEVGAKKEAEAEAIKERLARILGEPKFNPRSPNQVLNLFKLLGVGYLGSTDKAAMLKAKAAHPLNNFLLSLVTDYREAAKLCSTYFKEAKLWNGRLFYSFNPGGTDTGRLACTASNFWCGFQIQNIPRGDILKQCFVSEDGWYWAEPDKAQSEARCVGYLSGDRNLIELVESGHDYHSWNAEQFFGVPYAEIYDEAKKKTLNKLLRDLAKRTNHGANYNMGGYMMLDTMGPKLVAMAKKTLNLPAQWTLQRVCEFLLKRYEETYPDVKGTWYEHLVNLVEMIGHLVSPLGWTRKVFGNPRKNKQNLNSVVAHDPQNLSVGIINKEWYIIWRSSIYGELRNRVRIKAQVHDSLPFQFREKDFEAVEIVQSMMQTAVPVKAADGITRILKIPTDMSIGNGFAKRWSELK